MSYSKEYKKYLANINIIKNYFSCNIRGDINQIKETIINKEIFPNNCDEEGENLLHYIASSKDFDEKLTEFLTMHININIPDDYGRTPIHIAALSGNLEFVNYLLKNMSNLHLNVFKNDSNGYNLLHYAIVGGNKNIVEVLIKKDFFDPNKKDSNGLAPIHFAYLTGNTEVLEFLIEQPKIDIFSTDNKGNNIYDLIVLKDNEEKEIINKTKKVLEEIVKEFGKEDTNELNKYFSEDSLFLEENYSLKNNYYNQGIIC